MTLANGTKLGRYEVRSQLGAGGMGEVYLAHDTSELERTVALKILPAELASNAQRMQRFIQEARTVSALNHPNILTIHEIGEAAGTRFIVTEYIDGVTLREHLKTRRVKLHEVLDICIQVAAALDAAHEAKVIHRDIKPENIMVRRRDHIVKVLDFGLAKLAENSESMQPSKGIDSEAGTKVLVHTQPGLVMGTVSYMSPEQSQGSASVDHRTDIWSLGVVLYEMVAGRLPFEGKDIHRQIISIQESELPPLSRHAERVPDRLEEIVEKALAKNADERYQTAKDFLIDLRNLKRRLEVDAEIERTVAPDLRNTTTGAKDGTAQPAPATASQSAVTTARAEQTNAASSAEYLVNEIKRHKRGVVVALATLVVALAGVGYFLWSASTGKAIDSIAVLPFVNTSNDPNTEYLSDGIAETLINSLTELRQLRVIARSTAFRYRGKDVDPQQIGRELGVKSVLMGHMRQSGDTLDIQVDLVDVDTGAQLWGQEFQGKASDVLTMKQTIARTVTEKLRLRLTGEDERRLAKRDTTNPEAYQAYMRGRYYWNKRTADGIKKGIEHFQQAIDRDPNYALGYVGLADCYLLLEQYAGTPTSETLPKAKGAVDRALQIDDTLAEAHTSLAYIYMSQWRWAEAEEEYKRAISLNPNYPTAHHWFAVYFFPKRQFDDALREIKRAQELDPLSPIIGSTTAFVYLLKNNPDSAIEQCRSVIELDPNFPSAHLYLGWSYFMQRHYEEATAEFQKAVETSGRASFDLSCLGYCYAVTGRRAEALAILKELEDKYDKREAFGLHLAHVYGGLGDKDKAFAWLERDFQQRNGSLPDITNEFGFEDLRSDPRYADLVRRMGLEP